MRRNVHVSKKEPARRPRRAPRGGLERDLPENLTQSAQFSMPMTVTFPKNVIGFPDRLITVLKYSEAFTFTGSTVPAAQVMRMNSAFDPNATGTGHQPSFFDTYSAVYGRYFVRHFKLELEITNVGSTSSAYVVANYTDQDFSANSVEQIIESKYSRYKVVAINSAGKSVITINLPWMSTMKLMGQPGTEADDNMYAAVSGNPSDVGWGIVKCSAVDGLTNINVYIRMVIYQEIVFKDLLPQISS